MNTMLHSVIYFYLSFLFYSCNYPNNNKSITKNQDILAFNTDKICSQEKVNVSTFFSDIHSITLDNSKPNSLIGFITQIEFYRDNLFFIGNRPHLVYMFDIKGNFVKQIGGTGKGPGEYLQPLSFQIDTLHKRIIIYDSKLLRFTYYTLNGEYVSVSNAPDGVFLKDFCFMDESVYYAALMNNKDIIFTANPNNTSSITNSWINNRIYNKGYTGVDLWNGRIFYREKEKNALYFSLMFCDTIFKVTDKQVSPYIVLNSKNSISNKSIEIMYSDPMQITKFLKTTKYQCSINSFLQNDRIIYFRFKNEGQQYDLFYSRENKKTVCTSELYNDIMPEMGLYFQEILGNKYMLTVYNANEIIKNKTNIAKSKFLTKEEKKKFENVTDESNPVLVFYKFRDKWK